MSLVQELLGGVFWQQGRGDEHNHPFSNLRVFPPTNPYYTPHLEQEQELHRAQPPALTCKLEVQTLQDNPLAGMPS